MYQVAFFLLAYFQNGRHAKCEISITPYVMKYFIDFDDLWGYYHWTNDNKLIYAYFTFTISQVQGQNSIPSVFKDQTDYKYVFTTS